MKDRTHDWRLVPLAIGALAGALAGTSSDLWPVVACVAALAGVPLIRKRSQWAAIGVLGCAILAVLAGALAWQRTTSHLAELARDKAIVTAEIRIVSEPRPRKPKPPLPPSASALVQVQWVEGRGTRMRQSLPALATANGSASDALLGLATGSRHIVEGRLASTEPGDDAVAILRIKRVVEQTSTPGPLETIAAAMRQGLRDAVANSPPGQRALVPSLVVGDISRVDQQMEDEFKATALTHLMAVSGANLALMLGVVLGLLRFIGVRGWSVRVVALGGVAMFVIICGPEPSVQRAACMGVVALASTGVGKGRRSVRALSVAVIVLMALDPWLSRAPGFWLSVAACLGIVVLGSTWIEALTKWLPRWVAEGLAIPLSAQVATQPIVTWLSGEVSLVGVLTNVAAGPFVGPTTVFGFAAACLSFLPPVSAAAGWLAGWAAQPILWIASFGAGLPSSTITWEAGLVGVILMAMLCGAAAVLLTPLLQRAWASLLAFVMLLSAILVRPNPPGWPGDWSMAFCDVGQGDATVLRVDDTTAVLVDVAGEAPPVVDCLESLGVQQLAMIVLTHYHADHIGGFDGVVRRFPTAQVLTSRTPSPAEAAEGIRRSSPAPVREAAPGERIDIGAVQWRTIAAPEARVLATEEGESAAENDTSIIAVAAVDGVRLLITGDVELNGQVAALREADHRGLSLQADVLSLPHHGASKQDPRFVDATDARIAVVSAGEDNPYGHPAGAALDLARQHGMQVIRTDEQGTLTIGRESDTLSVRKTK